MSVAQLMASAVWCECGREIEGEEVERGHARGLLPSRDILESGARYQPIKYGSSESSAKTDAGSSMAAAASARVKLVVRMAMACRVSVSVCVSFGEEKVRIVRRSLERKMVEDGRDGCKRAWCVPRHGGWA
jgi:hypothetical protein